MAIIHIRVLKIFQELKEEFGLSNINKYQYLQLRHALTTQFKEGWLKWSKNPLLKKLVEAPSLKGMISKWCKNIHLKVLEKDSQLSSRVKWEEDMGKLTDSQCNGIVTSIDILSLSAAQRLTQFYNIHRTYYTPKIVLVWETSECSLPQMWCCKWGFDSYAL